jgi:hypothetical protein
MTTEPRPVPCGECDAFLAALDDQTRRGLALVRRYLDHQSQRTGQPHRHVGTARAEDIAACDRALQQELADRAEANRLFSIVVDMALFSLLDDETVNEWLARCAAAGDTATVEQVRALMNEALRIEEGRTDFFGGRPLLRRAGKGNGR